MLAFYWTDDFIPLSSQSIDQQVMQNDDWPTDGLHSDCLSSCPLLIELRKMMNRSKMKMRWCPRRIDWLQLCEKKLRSDRRIKSERGTKEGRQGSDKLHDSAQSSGEKWTDEAISHHVISTDRLAIRPLQISLEEKRQERKKENKYHLCPSFCATVLRPRSPV